MALELSNPNRNFITAGLRRALHRFVLVVAALTLCAGVPAEHAVAAPLAAGVSASVAPGQKPHSVAVGFYLTRISEISQKDGTFDFDGWFWFRWKGDGPDPTKTFELVNGRIESAVPTEVQEDQGFHYAQLRVHAKIFHVFDVRQYPLDDHVLPIIVEDSTRQSAFLQLEPDQGSGIDPSVALEGWSVAFDGAKVNEHRYQTNYGFRTLGDKGSDFSRLTFFVTLARQSSFLSLLKLFWVTALALLLSIGAFFVHSSDLDARFGLALGAIFAACANTLSLSADLPDTPILTLAEQIDMLTVLAIFLTIFISIFSLRLRYAGRPHSAERLDHTSAVVVAVGYLAALALILFFRL